MEDTAGGISGISRKTAENETDHLSAKISLLESKYAELDKKINLDYAHSVGFIDITVPRYVSRIDTHDTFTLRDTTEGVQ